MSLDAPVFKFNNIYTFYSYFQKHIRSFSNPYAVHFERIKDLPILNTVSSNINISMDIIRSKGEFDLNFANSNSNLSFENFQIDQIIDAYKMIIDKLITPVNNILYLFNNNTNNIAAEYTRPGSNKLLCDLINEIRKKDTPKQVIDIYITEYMNVPKSYSNIINFIYFIRRFPLIRFLFNHYLYFNYSSYMQKIRDHSLDNINYLLFREEGVESQALVNLRSTGLFSFDYDYHEDGEGYNALYRNIRNPNFVFDRLFDNSFVELCNGCKNRELKKYNTIAAIGNNNKIESVIYLFPFLYKINDIFQLKSVIGGVIRRILEGSIGVQRFQDKIYIRDPYQIFNSIMSPDNLIGINERFELPPLERQDPILLRFILLFAFDLVIEQINMDHVFVNLRLEDILIRMSTFILNVYGVYKRGMLEQENNFNSTIGYTPDVWNPIVLPLDPPLDPNNPIVLPLEQRRYQAWYNILIPSESRNISYFYLFAARTLFSDIKFKRLVEDDLFKMSHLFYTINYFNNDVKELNPLFTFAAFSDGKNKWIKNYNYKKNHFLDWLNDYFDYCFPDVETFVVK